MNFYLNRLLAVVGMLFSCLPVSGSDPATTFNNHANRFFNKYVYDGKVDYRTISRNPEKLEKLVELIGNSSLEDARPDVRKAFWINAYNILVIREVIRHYPLNSVFVIPDFFDRKSISLKGEMVSLNDIEKTRLQDGNKDIRLRLLICKGQAGQPPLHNEAVTPELMATRLIDQSKAVLNDTNYIKTNPDGFWQMADFFSDYRDSSSFSHGSFQGFVNKFRDRPVGPDYLMTYFKSDTLLNDDDRYRMQVETMDSIPDPTHRGFRHELASDANDGRLAELNLVPYRQLEIHLNNHFFFYDETYSKRLDRSTLKYSYASNLATLQLTYGVGRKTTIGLAANAKTAVLSNPDARPAEVFNLKNDTNAVYYMRSINPFIRMSILEGKFQVRMQQIFNIPVNRVQPLDYGNIKVFEENLFLLTSQLFISTYLSDYVKAGLEIDFAFRFNRNFETFTITPRTILNTVFSMPLSRTFRIYGVLETAPNSNTSSPLKSYYVKEGAGLRARLKKNEVTLYYSYVFLGKKVNAFNSLVLNISIGI